MEAIFSPEYSYLWAFILALALFIPVRNLIYALAMRRAQKNGEPNEADARRLKKRAAVTAILLCAVFAFFYTNQLFKS